jgi:hypothetical protein
MDDCPTSATSKFMKKKNPGTWGGAGGGGGA